MNKTPASSAPAAPRAYALDALRGFAILAMLLSGQEPFGKLALPAWMYHAQEPPPDHEWLGHLPGITWVDLVFPFFLFCMGAAFPLALARRMDQGATVWRLGRFILERGFLLGFFALYVQAIRPFTLSHHPDTGVWLLALLGFLLLFPVLTRLPEGWSPGTQWLVRGVGWAGAILFLALARYPDGSGFSLKRSDIIIVVLTNMAVFGSLIWMLTRHQWLPRLGVLGFVLALRLANMPEALGGWVTDLWKYSPLPWIYQLYYLQYLCIVIPGTIAGDMILQWIRAGATPGSAPGSAAGESEAWSAGRYVTIAGLMLGLVVVLLAGLETRCPTELPVTTPGVFLLNDQTWLRPWLLPATLLAFALCGLGNWLLRGPGTAAERLYQKLFRWGTYWLVLGLFFEPYEGGIRKDHATLSYYFVTAGLAHCVLIAFSIVIDRFQRRRWLQLLIDNGQNPMIAYAGINNFITPVLALTLLLDWSSVHATTPWLGFVRGLTITLLMAVTVSWLTRRKIFWRT